MAEKEALASTLAQPWTADLFRGNSRSVNTAWVAHSTKYGARADTQHDELYSISAGDLLETDDSDASRTSPNFLASTCCDVDPIRALGTAALGGRSPQAKSQKQGAKKG